MVIDGLTTEARNHFQGPLQSFLPTLSCLIFILPSVDIYASQGGLEAIHGKALCDSRVAGCKELVPLNFQGTTWS